MRRPLRRNDRGEARVALDLQKDDVDRLEWLRRADGREPLPVAEVLRRAIRRLYTWRNQMGGKV